MKKIFFVLLAVVLAMRSFAQTEAISPVYRFNIKKKVVPPILALETSSIRIVDEDGNGILNANEKVQLIFKVKNSGEGDGLNLQLKLNTTGSSQGVACPTSKALQAIMSHQNAEIKVEWTTGMNTLDGVVIFTLEIEEPNGFNTDAVQIEMKTQQFISPMVQVVDHAIYSNDGDTQLGLAKPFNLQLLVQNTGQGDAKNVTIHFPIPDNTFLMSGEEDIVIDYLAAGEQRSIDYGLVINKKFTGTSIAFNADLSETYGKYAKDWNGNFTLNQALSSEKLVVQGTAQASKNIEVASLRSDVDKDIPLGLSAKSNRYALIIGNEDYAKYQLGLDQEVNVDFARNDAQVMAEYAEKVLGYPKNNIVVLKDATKGQMSQEITKLVRFAEIEKGKAELLFYYSGHGLPDEISKDPFLIPVDVNGTQVTNGYALNELYRQLSLHPTERATVILDACFSGGARNKELVAMKGVKVKASVSNVPANLLVLASSSGQESSAVFKEKQHGLFTYYLMKSWKENKGMGSIQTQMEKVKNEVAKEATRMNKVQTPQMMVGPSLSDQMQTLQWGK
jgi:Caspase domain